jgi:hypothetical protein
MRKKKSVAFHFYIPVQYYEMSHISPVEYLYHVIPDITCTCCRTLGVAFLSPAEKKLVLHHLEAIHLFQNNPKAVDNKIRVSIIGVLSPRF